MIGFRRSSSVNPMALNMERAGARSRPSVMVPLRCLSLFTPLLVSVAIAFPASIPIPELQPVINTFNDRLPRSSDYVFTYAHGIPRLLAITRFDVNARFCGGCFLPVEDADFEVDQMEFFDDWVM